MFRIIALCCLSLAAVAGCDDGGENLTSFGVGPNGEYPIPGLGLDNEVWVTTGHVGYGLGMESEEVLDEPSVGRLRVIDDSNTLAEDELMFQDERLRFTYDDTTFELSIEAFQLGDSPRDHRATLFVERL